MTTPAPLRPLHLTLFLAGISAPHPPLRRHGCPRRPCHRERFRPRPGNGSLPQPFLAGYAITPVLGGQLADRRRLVLLAALTLFVLAELLAAAASPSLFVLAARHLLRLGRRRLRRSSPSQNPRPAHRSLARRRIAASLLSSASFPSSPSSPAHPSYAVALSASSFPFSPLSPYSFCSSPSSYPSPSRPTAAPSSASRSLPATTIALLAQSIFLGHAIVYALNFACIFSFMCVAMSLASLLTYTLLPRSSSTA